MAKYTEGVCCDGAGILCDGALVKIERVLELLNKNEDLEAQVEKLTIELKWARISRDNAEEEVAKSVPFELIKNEKFKCGNKDCKGWYMSEYCTKQTCPIVGE